MKRTGTEAKYVSLSIPSAGVVSCTKRSINDLPFGVNISTKALRSGNSVTCISLPSVFPGPPWTEVQKQYSSHRVQLKLTKVILSLRALYILSL